MKQTVLLILLVLFYKGSTAQAYDRSWLIGTECMIKLTMNGINYDTSSFECGTARTLMDLPGSNISDTAGNILFFSVGSRVGNPLAQIMENGDTLVDSLFFATVFDIPAAQATLILPRSNNTFYLFYYSESDSLLASNFGEPDRLYYAIVDMNANGGLGKVLKKKQVVHKGLLGEGRLTACRHANGRDWWMVHQGYADDAYYIYLVTPDSVYPPHIQHIGPSNFWDNSDAAFATFSPDGSKFATVTAVSPLILMDFDRCTGTFSNPDSIFIPTDTFRYNGYPSPLVTLNGGSSCSFSPNGRYLYFTNLIDIVQYDTWALNVQASAVTVGRWDTVGPAGGDAEFYLMYLLPNGKIIVDDYGPGVNGSFHLIDSPDIGGRGCHFRFNGLPTTTNNANVLPNMINYRLGALAGSGCDTVTGISESKVDKSALKLYPNPANSKITVSLMQYYKNAKLYIYDALGREMYKDESMYLDADIDLGGFTNGIYFVRILSPDGNAAAKFVKE